MGLDFRVYEPFAEGTMSTGQVGDTVNFNLARGKEMCDLLGIVPVEGDFAGLYGEESGENFLGRVLLALALAGTREVETPAVQDGRFFEGGRRLGYFAERLAELRTLAEQAVACGGTVVWDA
jgi:hypothetical protein